MKQAGEKHYTRCTEPDKHDLILAHRKLEKIVQLFDTRLQDNTNYTYGGLSEDDTHELKLERILMSINHVGLQRQLMVIDGETIEAAVRAVNEYPQAATITGPAKIYFLQKIRLGKTWLSQQRLKRKDDLHNRDDSKHLAETSNQAESY